MHHIRPFFSHSIFISICAAALAMQTFVLRGQKHLDLTTLLFVATSTLGAYNFYWFIAAFKRKQSGGDKSPFLSGLSLHILLMLLPAMILINLLWRHPDWIGYFAIGTVISIVYTLLMFTRYTMRLLPLMGILKTILLTAAWTFITACFPLIYLDHSMVSTQLNLIGNRFIFVLMIAVIFDARDVEKDLEYGTGTIATVFGQKKLNAFMTGLVLTFVMLTMMLPEVELMCKLLMMACGGVVYLLYFLAQSPRSDVFYYFLMDGMMIIFSVSAYIACI
jgi:hypothetical protein